MCDHSVDSLEKRKMNLTNYDEIRALLARHGFRFSKSMGQNFLTASWVPEQIADSAMLDDKTAVLEIGPGIGCLTEQLSRRAAKVISIELDKTLMPVLAESLTGCENTEVIFGDAMKLDISKIVAEDFKGYKPVVCANLPYNVTSPILTKLINCGCFDAITVMIQREVARRICAGAGDDDYSAFGIFVQWYMNAEILFDVPPSCFVPQPKVTSSVIRLTRRSEPPAEVSDEKLMFSLIRAAFNMRRKTLVNAVSSNLPEIDKETFASVLEKCGFDARVRGEALSVSDFALIADEIVKK